MKWLPFYLLVLPFAELWLLIKIGSVIGAWLTVFLVLLGVLVGIVVIRLQGEMALVRLPYLLHPETAAQEMLDSLLQLLAGLLFLFPGFITDALAIALLFPSVRTRLMERWLQRRPGPPPSRPRGPATADRGVIEGESRRIDP